jgi:glycosyltransferase involved in cell wall biosynthesis
MIDQALRTPAFDRLSIVFPMWNEEEYVGRAVRAGVDVCLSLSKLGEIKDFEIVVVNDASTDDTGKLADEMASMDSRIRVIHHEVNRKLGGSIKSGLAAATGDVILYTDADLPFDMTELIRATRILRTYEADMVCAYRLDRTGEGVRRVLYSWAYNVLIEAAFRTRIRDINFAFKLMRRSALDRIHLKSEGSFIDAELVVRARQARLHIIQIGVDYFPRSRGISTLSSFPVIKTMLREMRSLRKELRVPSDRPSLGGK